MYQRSSKRKSLILFLWFFIFFSALAWAQDNIPIGTWRTHFSYRSINLLILAGNQVFAAGESGIIVFDKEDNSLTKLSKIDGFSETEVSALAYHEENNLVVIGYANGNVDLYREGVIVNFDEFKKANIPGSKRINHITFHLSRIYFSTNIGVVVFDPGKMEIRGIYGNIGPGGARILAYASLVYNDSLFLATHSGIMAGSLNERVNLLDFANWKRFGSEEGILNVPVRTLSRLNNKVFAGIDQEGLFVYDGNSWEKATFTTLSRFNFIKSSQNKLLIGVGNDLYSSTSDLDFTKIEDPAITEPTMAVIDLAENIWIADQSNGLISNFEGAFKSYIPSGPFSNKTFKLFNFHNKIVGVSGGYSSSFNALNNLAGFYIFENGQWQNFNPHLGNMPQVADLVGFAYLPQSNKLFFASYGKGLLEWDNHNSFNIINDQSIGSPLQNPTTSPNSTLISGLASDPQGQLWITNYGVNQSLHLLNEGGSWQSFSFKGSDTRFPLGILVAANNDKWMRLRTERGSKVLVFNEVKNSSRILSNLEGEGALPGNIITDLVQDKNGYIWIGTDLGIVYILNPYSVLDNDRVNAIEPIYNNGFLLRGEHITSLKIDGGNRKWIGTTRGIWLFDEAGESLIHHFTIDNSPLPSNNILDISIEEKTGEVFMATGKGMISYRGTATRGETIHRNVKIFPNPVRPNFNGLLGISGLADDAIVKITDIGGRLVKQVYAEGGTAVWDVNDHRGRRVRSGIYLVLSSSADGEETFIGKIAVIE
ncbi:two-component regulator propeller domain-containing protein [soil metagenome]